MGRYVCALAHPHIPPVTSLPTPCLPEGFCAPRGFFSSLSCSLGLLKQRLGTVVARSAAKREWTPHVPRDQPSGGTEQLFPCAGRQKRKRRATHNVGHQCKRAQAHCPRPPPSLLPLLLLPAPQRLLKAVSHFHMGVFILVFFFCHCGGCTRSGRISASSSQRRVLARAVLPRGPIPQGPVSLGPMTVSAVVVLVLSAAHLSSAYVGSSASFTGLLGSRTAVTRLPMCQIGRLFPGQSTDCRNRPRPGMRLEMQQRRGRGGGRGRGRGRGGGRGRFDFDRGGGRLGDGDGMSTDYVRGGAMDPAAVLDERLDLFVQNELEDWDTQATRNFDGIFRPRGLGRSRFNDEPPYGGTKVQRGRVRCMCAPNRLDEYVSSSAVSCIPRPQCAFKNIFSPAAVCILYCCTRVLGLNRFFPPDSKRLAYYQRPGRLDLDVGDCCRSAAGPAQTPGPKALLQGPSTHSPTRGRRNRG